MLLVNGKTFFISQKKLKVNYLWASIAFELWLVIHFNHQKYICGVTSDGCLVFPAKLLLNSLLICYCLMENHFSEFKKTSNSFTCELQKHLNYSWLYILTIKNKYVEWLVMVAWIFQPNYCYIHFQYVMVMATLSTSCSSSFGSEQNVCNCKNMNFGKKKQSIFGDTNCSKSRSHMHTAKLKK